MGAASPRMAVTMIAETAEGIATVRRVARRHAPNDHSALPDQRGRFPTVLRRVLPERRQYAAANPAMVSTLTGTMTVSDAND